MNLIVEMKREGTLIFIYVMGKALRECWTNQSWMDASIRYERLVKEKFNNENSERKLLGRDPVTIESFEKFCKKGASIFDLETDHPRGRNPTIFEHMNDATRRTAASS